MLRFSGTGATHVGLVRGNNEDSGFVGPTCMLVADGVGGGAAGEVASATATYAVSATALQMAGADPLEVLPEAVAAAQAQVAAGVLLDPSRSGMATTLTALFTDGTRVGLAHLGDSRGYLVRDLRLTRITRDHTYVQDLVDEGTLAESEAAEHPWRNVVMRSINGDLQETAEVTVLDLRPGDRVLLATDGLTDLVTEPWIEEMLLAHTDDEAVQALVAAALGRGGRDNVTVLLATVVDGPTLRGDGQLLGAVRVPGNIVDLSAIRAADTA